MICFYHNDLDGHAAGFCVHAWVGIKKGTGTFIEIDYRMPFPVSSIEPGEQVWIVDYSIQPSEMDTLLSITDDVTWIDHHKTAIDKYANYPKLIRGVRQTDISAAALSWKYIHWWTARGYGPIDTTKVAPCLGLEMPTVIGVVSNWDTWKWKELGTDSQETVLNFVNAAKIHDTKPGSSFWWECMDIDMRPKKGTGNAEAQKRGILFWQQLQDEGWVIRKYDEMRNAHRNSALGWSTMIDGHKAWAINAWKTSSESLGGDSAMDRHEILVSYYHDGRKFTVTLYSKKVDVSEIAKAHGGGGHKGAAGFVCDELPFKPKEGPDESDTTKTEG